MIFAGRYVGSADRSRSAPVVERVRIGDVLIAALFGLPALVLCGRGRSSRWSSRSRWWACCGAGASKDRRIYRRYVGRDTAGRGDRLLCRVTGDVGGSLLRRCAKPRARSLERLPQRAQSPLTAKRPAAHSRRARQVPPVGFKWELGCKARAAPATVSGAPRVETTGPAAIAGPGR